MSSTSRRTKKMDEFLADNASEPTGEKSRFFSDFKTKGIRSEALLQGEREVVILHNEEMYRLMVTKNNKLILQK
ncbi:MAG: hemin uptake protein HemP [Pirellulales bacterium]|nr:hemin uptake protein HemP [Pirellulales bacterium]